MKSENRLTRNDYHTCQNVTFKIINHQSLINFQFSSEVLFSSSTNSFTSPYVPSTDYRRNRAPKPVRDKTPTRPIRLIGLAVLGKPCGKGSGVGCGAGSTTITDISLGSHFGAQTGSHFGAQTGSHF